MVIRVSSFLIKIRKAYIRVLHLDGSWYQLLLGPKRAVQ